MVYSSNDLAGTSSRVNHSVTAVATSVVHYPLFWLSGRPDYLFLDDIVLKPVPEPGYFAAAGFALAFLFAHKAASGL